MENFKVFSVRMIIVMIFMDSFVLCVDIDDFVVFILWGKRILIL